MAAASERVGEYRAKAQQFSKRVFDFLSIMFKFQVDQVLNPKDAAAARDKNRLKSHAAMEDFLGRYCGLMLFVKEIDQQRYQLICSVRRCESSRSSSGSSWVASVGPLEPSASRGCPR